MVAPDHNGSLDDTLCYKVVEGASGPVALAVAQPADARGQTLEVDLLPRERDPAFERLILWTVRQNDRKNEDACNNLSSAWRAALSGSSASAILRLLPQPVHVAHGWDAEEAFVLSIEVGGVVIPHAIGRTGRVEVFAQHQTAGLLEP